MENIRLQKYFTDCGVLSRRAAEAEIATGHVTVNGETATLGQKIDPATDVVRWDGREILPPKKQEHTTVMLHKPAGFVTTTSDEEGRPCVTDLLTELNVRLYPIGRLDMNSTGLLLLTNDGELANLLTHPRHHVPKVYHVKVGGEISPATVKKLGSPMTIDGYRIRPAKVECIETYEHKSLLEITLNEGRNRQIRKMCASLGLHILSLQRVAMGPVTLGHLPLGKFRYLGPTEVEALRNAARKAAEQADDIKDAKPGSTSSAKKALAKTAGAPASRSTTRTSNRGSKSTNDTKGGKKATKTASARTSTKGAKN